MQYPNFSEEKKLRKMGFSFVAGLDEAGRGPLAGPVVASAVMVNPQTRQSDKLEFARVFAGINDSKKLSEKKRQKFYDILTNHKDIRWGVGVVSEKIIDKVNILNATKLAMQKAIDSLSCNLQSFTKRGTLDFLIIDGNFSINKLSIPQKSIIGADGKVFSCAAAGIIAKVTRDNMMHVLHNKYPMYGFDEHKGYGTKLHIKNLYSFGPCKIHRKTFFPVSSIAKRETV